MKIIENIEVPKRLKVTKKEEQFLREILKMRPKENWTINDVTQAVYLARTQVTIEKLHNDLLKKGDVYMNEKGVLVPYPEHALIEQLTRRVITISRSIHIHAEATQGRARDAMGAKELKEIEAKRTLSKFVQLPPPKISNG